MADSTNLTKLIAQWEPKEFLDIILGLDVEPLKQVLKLFGGRNRVIHILSIYFKSNPEYLDNEQYRDLFQSILFECSGSDTYSEDWEKLWDTLQVLPLKFMLHVNLFRIEWMFH